MIGLEIARLGDGEKMKYLSRLVLLVVMASAVGRVEIAEKARYPFSITGTVVGVHDGDTITVLVAKDQYKIRLDGIDAPELSQAFGRVAKTFVSDRVFGKKVEVRISNKDRYGRYIGEVFIAGRSVNREIVAAGLAWQYRQYSKDAELARLEAEARAKRIGLWKDAHPIPPWDYRKR